MTGRKFAVSAVLLVLTAGVPVEAAELWRGPPVGEDCRVTLVNELGGVRIAPSPPASETVAAVHGASELSVAASTDATGSVLSVHRAARSGLPGSGDVDLVVPAGCVVAVRTTEGAVRLDVGRPALPVAVDTVTGDITAWVDADTDATILLATSGEITTDLTIEIEFRHHQEPAKHGRIATRRGATPGRVDQGRC